MIKKHNKNVAVICTALLLVLFLIIPLTNVFAAPSVRTIKIGANHLFGVDNTNGNFSGLACDYFNALSKYTDDKYEYVEGTPDELFEMLKNGEIDMIPCVTESERAFYENKLGGSNEELFTKAGVSLVPKFSAVYVYDKGERSGTIFNDVSAIRRMNIGYLADYKQNYFRNDRFIYSEIEGANFVPYSDEDVMYSAFISGEIDAVAKDCFDPWMNETIVYQFPAVPGYCVVRSSDKDSLSRLVNGLSSLFSEQPTFYGDVYERRVTNYGSQKFAYTAIENDFIKSHSSVTLGYNLEADSLESYNGTNGTLEKMIGSIVKKYSEITGLKINVRTYNNLNECISALSDKEVDMIYGGISPNDVSKYPNFYITNSVLSSPIVLAGKKDCDTESIAKIAVKNGNEAITSLNYLYPDAFFTFVPNTDSICQLTESGKCDAACITSYEAMYMKNNGYPDLEILKVLPGSTSECFALRQEDKGLCGVTEYTLAAINGADLISDVYNIAGIKENTDTKQKPFDLLPVIIIAGPVLITVTVIVIIVLKNKRRSEIDMLTGGLTKKSFIDNSLKSIKKLGSANWALIVFDIDKFKFINDRLGYEEGNNMLERVYKTLGDQMESGETYARISDDNFACCVFGASDNDITNRLNSVFDEFERRNSLYVSYPVFFSAGVCRLEQCVTKYGLVNFNVAIDHCNIAKKTIKGMHSNAIAFYDGKIREKALREKDFENAMPSALENHEFMCYIQPKYGAKSRRIEGGEALIRWKSSEFGFVFPNDFIPIAEKNDFVVELDFFILEEVCKTMRSWLDNGITPVVISVNMSRVHLTHDDFIWRLREIVDKYAIPYEYIELELTETVFTENADLLLRVMRKLHDIGFQLSIDDFGSGYSSLNMLKDIPADVVKIDREFFNGTVNSDKGRAVITTVIDLAKKLDMHVISECVETLDQVEFLAEKNCDLIQGYYFAKPMPFKDFEELWFKELEENNDKNTQNPDGTAQSE